MSTHVISRYDPIPMATASSYTFAQGSPLSIGGFLCVTAGTITVTRADGLTVIAAFPLTAGTWVPIPFYLGAGATIQLGAGCSGTLAVG